MSMIAVTGANGMTGSHMINFLKNKGVSCKPVTREEWDLTEWKNFDELDSIFGDVKVIFHFAAQLPTITLSQNSLNIKQVFDTNVRSCLNLAEWSSRRNIAIIFLSTSVVYKNPHAISILEEDDKVANGYGGFYGYSKLLAEDVFKYWSENNLKCTILRPSSLYGYGLPADKLIQNFLDIASSGGTISVSGPGNKVNFIHAYDVSKAAWQAYINKSWGVYNISSSKANSILEVAQIAISISKKGKISIVDNQDNADFVRFNLNSKLAKKHFNFNPEIDLESGMTLMKKKMFTLR